MRGYVSGREKANGFSGKAVRVFLIFAAVILAFLLCRATINAAEYEDEEGSRSITVVFDNSGTMYTSTAWCEATYALEVFVAMADEEDEIGIYPLNPIEVDGVTYTRDDPLIVHGGSDASVIRQIYTPSSGDTHIETVEDAFGGLLNMDGEDKWLILMTDGDIFYEDGYPLDSEYGEDRSVTQERLSTMLSDYSDSVNVIYLGIGDQVTVPTIEGSGYSQVRVSTDPSDTPWDMIEISNLIYDRDKADISSETLEFDQPVANLVLYVAGDDIESLRLVDADGNEAGTLMSGCSLLYAEAPGSGSVANSPEYYAGNAADTSLGGEVASYGPIPAGTYSIQYEGSSSAVRAYYEPDENILLITEEEPEDEEVAEIVEDSGLAEAEEMHSESERTGHRARFWVLLIILFIAIAAVIVFLVFMYQKALPNGLRARVTGFTLNGNDYPDIKKAYLRYSGGGKKTGTIVIGPRPGTTDYDYKITLHLEARSRRIKRSNERGAIIVSPPTKIGYITEYAIDGDRERFEFTMEDQVKTKDRIYLGQKFTYTMKAQKKDAVIPEYDEYLTMVIELQFK